MFASITNTCLPEKPICISVIVPLALTSSNTMNIKHRKRSRKGVLDQVTCI